MNIRKFTRAELMERAQEQTDYMEIAFYNETESSVRGTEYYNERVEFSKIDRRHVTSFYLEPISTVDAIYNAIVSGSVTALNFASYKHAGGRFLDGSSAQEEAICHESNLYNILKRMPRYYASNMKALNKGLYLNRGLYTPNVVFNREGLNPVLCDIITCAAPNASVAIRHQNVSKEENYKVLKDRVDFMLAIAAEHDPVTLILGAWGCGVFKQDPNKLVEIYDSLLGITSRYRGKAKYSDVFNRVVFAIPDRASKQYIAFYNYLTTNFNM